MITILPYDKEAPIEMVPDERFEIIERFDDGTILVEDQETGETRHLRKITVQ